MQRSTERILTTHTGSLPRPDDLVPLLYAQATGEPVDTGQLAVRVREAVAEIVRKQTDVGLDVINDGEMGKVGYSTYVATRLTGYSGEGVGVRNGPSDIREFPNYAQQRRRPQFPTPACTGPVSYRDPAAARADLDNLAAAVA